MKSSHSDERLPLSLGTTFSSSIQLKSPRFYVGSMVANVYDIKKQMNRCYKNKINLNFGFQVKPPAISVQCG